VGKTFPFKVIRPLGKGGMGETVLVSDPSQDDELFVLKKVPKKSFPEKIELLRKEFATLTRLSHPNIARVFKFGEEAKSYYFFEEYVEGSDLFQATYQGNYNQILAALAQVLRALIYLHHQGFIHGDLKAENILVVRNASLFSEDSVKLIDFGLARHRKDLNKENLPSGSLYFMAPEILLEKPYDHRADLYALGVCLYRMITGRYPFEHEKEDLHRLVQAQISQMPVDPERFQTDLPKGLKRNHDEASREVA
jgi:serine/threonine protein kinase